MNIQEAKEKIQKLLDKYNKYKDDKNFAGNEKQACQTLIVPLIKDVLDWNTEEYSEFKTEESKAGKRIDYVVCNENISQFIVEAKAPNKDVFDNTEYYKQALAYGYSKNHDFAILTNFRQLVILACKIKIRLDREAEIARIDLTNLTDDNLKLLLCFEKNYWISSGKNNILYTKLGTHKSRIPVDEQLLDDMKIWRSTLLTNIQKNGKNKFDFEDEQEFMKVEEEVQKFIDRLIFICFCEDKELEEAQLKGIMYDKEQRFGIKPGFLLGKIQELFEKYRKTYDSDLFDKSYCDRLVIEDDKLMSLIQDLREPKDRVAYDFKSIEADILGKVYEQFIGHVQTGKKRFKEKEDLGKRKKEGIYYTPKYIVDYIVNNTVKEYLKGKSFEEINKVKILDPACGSGSFLLRAFDILVQESENRLKRELNYDEKKNLMLNCIHGVDLDERAVAIAKLNLALKLAERNKPLPVLRENIKHGNSLINDKNVAGEWNAFVWEEEFKEIMSSGGFDVVVGNPPYVSINQIKKELRDYYSKTYETFVNKGDIYTIFIEKTIKHLIKRTGILSFIIPNTILTNTSFKNIRKIILDNCIIQNMISLGGSVFTSATVDTIILVIKKEKNNILREKHNIKIVTINDYANKKNNAQYLSQNYLTNDLDFNFYIYSNNEIEKMFLKIKDDSVLLKNISLINQGIKTGDDKKYVSKEKMNSQYEKVLFGKDIARYAINFGNKYVLYDKNKLMNARDEEIFLNKKILVQLIRNPSLKRRIIATFDDAPYYTISSITNIRLTDNKFNYTYVVGIINSKLINFIFQTKFIDVNVKPHYLGQIPIKIMPESQQQLLIKLVDKMLSLNKRLNEFGDKKTEERTKIEAEIKKTDDEIDEFVYKIYGITEEEKKIVEESLR